MRLLELEAVEAQMVRYVPAEAESAPGVQLRAVYLTGKLTSPPGHPSEAVMQRARVFRTVCAGGAQDGREVLQKTGRMVPYGVSSSAFRCPTLPIRSGLMSMRCLLI